MTRNKGNASAPRDPVSGLMLPVHGRSIEHDGSRNPTYTAWRGMRQRCNNHKRKDFAMYGGRGIKVCERWESFQAFFDDMGEKPANMQLGRIDNNGEYCPSNCRWETPKQQARNRRSSRVLIVFGEAKTLVEWSEVFEIPRDTLWRRLEAGWDIERALINPVEVRANSRGSNVKAHE